jgi:monoamine oxidase
MSERFLTLWLMGSMLMPGLSISQFPDMSRDPWATACERIYYSPGELPKYRPKVIEPHGRIHFAGAYADNLSWGQEAITRSANRVLQAIDHA